MSLPQTVVKLEQGLNLGIVDAHCQVSFWESSAVAALWATASIAAPPECHQVFAQESLPLRLARDHHVVVEDDVAPEETSVTETVAMPVWGQNFVAQTLVDVPTEFRSWYQWIAGTAASVVDTLAVVWQTWSTARNELVSKVSLPPLVDVVAKLVHELLSRLLEQPLLGTVQVWTSRPQFVALQVILMQRAML